VAAPWAGDQKLAEKPSLGPLLVTPHDYLTQMSFSSQEWNEARSSVAERFWRQRHGPIPSSGFWSLTTRRARAQWYRSEWVEHVTIVQLLPVSAVVQ